MTASYHRRHSTGLVNRVRRVPEIPSKFDWRDKGMVGPVRSQENCGACWAFSTIGVAESMYAIKNGTLYPFSVQEVGCCIPDTPFFIHTYTHIIHAKELLKGARAKCRSCAHDALCINAG